MPDVAHDDDQLIDTARRRLAQAVNADEHNRTEAKIDLQFLSLQQWDEGSREEREQSKPPRPIVTADRLTAFWNQVVNEIRKAQPAPNVAPRGNGASKQTAEVYEGKIRSILYDSDSQLAIGEAAKYAVGCSVGAFILEPEIVDEDTGQQELRINPIYDPSTLYWDPFAMRPDKADARWLIQTEIISRIEYRERWPDKLEAHSDFETRDVTKEWMDPRGDGEACMIAAYWTVEKVGSDAIAYGEDLDEDAFAEGKFNDWVGLFAKKKKRQDNGWRVVKRLIDGAQLLEEPEVRPGKYIPVFVVEGNSVIVDGKRYVSSLIRGARDSQREYNWEATKKIEMLANRSNAPYLVTPKQIQNHESQWQEAANRNATYLLVNPDPEMPGWPQRNDVAAPIEAIAASQQMTAQEIKDIIGLQDPNLGRAQYANQSGAAVDSLREEGNTATFHFTDNLARTLKHLGRVMVTWLPYYYDLEHEMLLLKADMTEETVNVNSPQPVQGPNGQMYHHDLTKGNYECVIDVATDYNTARKQDAAMYQNIIGANPEAFWVIGDLAIRYRDSPGADEAADRVKRAIALRMPGLIQDQQQSPIPPQVQTQIQGMQQQLQQLTQLVQAQAQEIKSRIQPKIIEAQSKMALAQVNQKTTLMKALMELKGKMHAATLQHGHAMYATDMAEGTDAVDQMLSMLHESELAPGPDQGAQGLHPSAPPMPMGPNGSPAGALPPGQ